MRIVRRCFSWKLLTRAGIGLSQEYTSMVYFNGHDPVNCNDEVYRSFRPDVRVWGWTGYFFTKERETFMPWWFAAHRFGGFSWFSATDFRLLRTGNLPNVKK